MRNLLLVLILSGAACNTAFSAEPVTKTDEAVIQELRLSPEKYLLKHVSLKVRFNAFKNNLPKYALVSGMKSDTYLWLNVHPEPLPVFMLKKGADLEMKRGAEFTLYCRVQKFSSTRFVGYYLLVERIEAEDKQGEESGVKAKDVKKSGSSTAVKRESPVETPAALE
ncbi:MAG: hypothetical protein WCV67_15875 [Victivallaceae bacterium]|jgi:hypothetical protein